MDSLKLVAVQRLQIGEPGPGYVHLASALDSGFLAQLCAETLEVTYQRGHPLQRWVRQGANEAFDLLTLAIAATAHMLPASALTAPANTNTPAPKKSMAAYMADLNRAVNQPR